jgi:type IX secretion system PorP/SprF family membrane protein
MKIIRLHIILLILALSFLARGQQDIMLSQQHFSRINNNPSTTEVSDYANAYLFARQQWIGFEGAPMTQVFNAHGYIDDIRSSVGLSVVSDIVGRSRYLSLMFAYAYHVRTGENSHLSLGLSAGLTNRRFDGNMITDEPEICPTILEMLMSGKSVYRPDVNFGITYSTPKFSFGVSATRLTRYLFPDDGWFRFPLHAYAFMELGIDFNENVRFTPRVQLMSALSSLDTISFMDRTDMMLDLGGTFSVRNRFWLGGSFRIGEKFDAGTSVAAMVGINIGPNIRVGYSYDHRLGTTFQNVKTFGTHEIMLNYRIRVTEVQAAEQTPRFFE